MHPQTSQFQLSQADSSFVQVVFFDTYQWLEHFPLPRKLDLNPRLPPDWGRLKVRSFQISEEQSCSSSAYSLLMAFSTPVVKALSTLSEEGKIYPEDTHKRRKPEILFPSLSISLTHHASYRDPRVWSKGKNLRFRFSPSKNYPFQHFTLPSLTLVLNILEETQSCSMDMILNTG